jgi:hypothetical protein
MRSLNYQGVPDPASLRLEIVGSARSGGFERSDIGRPHFIDSTITD